MGAPNFGMLYKASHYYVVMEIVDDPEFAVNYLREQITEELKDELPKCDVFEGEGWRAGDVSITDISTYIGLDCELCFYVVLRPGYYEAATLDFFHEIKGEEDIEDRDEKRQLVEELAKISEIIDKTIANYGMPYVKVAQFSNGETWYEPIKETKK